MKILRIEEGKAEFSTDGKDFRIITDIGKDNIISMLDTILNEEVKIDSEDKETSINNPAEQIIYNSLKEKFEGFMKQKGRINSELASTFEPIKSKIKSEKE